MCAGYSVVVSAVYCMVSVTVSDEKKLLRRQDNSGRIGAFHKRFILQVKIVEETF